MTDVLRVRRIIVELVAAAAVFVTGSAGIGLTSPAVAAPVQEDSYPPRDYVRPLEDFVADEEDRQTIESAGRDETMCGFFMDRRLQLPWYWNGSGRHAEENIDRAAVRELLTRAADVGKPLVVVCNRTPCSARTRTCETVLEEIGAEATEREARLSYAFTGRYEPNDPGRRTRYESLKRIASLGHEMFVAEPSTGLSWGAQRLASEILTLHSQGLFGSTERTGSAPEALTGQTDESGGIDFSSLELRYLAEPDDGDGLNYAFTAEPGVGDQPPGTGLAPAEQQSDAFFVWLSLPPSTFWVNLNPNEPDRIVDDQLGQTDAGRILLEADLQMKRTTAQLIHPDTPTGTQFWSSLDAGDGSQTCFSFRQWIVPAPASVYEDDTGLYILDAPLTVQLESEYLDERSTGSPLDACPGQNPAVDEHNEALFRSLILPQIEQAVNEAPEYADLRRVYLSRVGAEWYRQRSRQHTTSYGDLVDSGDVRSWVSYDAWSPQDVFDRYVESYTDGEFNITRETQQGDWIYTDTYFYGGVDFTSLGFDQVGLTEVQTRWPGVIQAVQDSLDRRSTDPSGALWLGSAVTPSAAPDADEPAAGPSATPSDDPPRRPDDSTTRPLLVAAASVTALLLAWQITRASRARASARRAAAGRFDAETVGGGADG